MLFLKQKQLRELYVISMTCTKEEEQAQKSMHARHRGLIMREEEGGEGGRSDGRKEASQMSPDEGGRRLQILQHHNSKRGSSIIHGHRQHSSRGRRLG